MTHQTLAITLTIVMLTGCGNPDSPKTVANENTQTQLRADSIALTTLVRNMYEWHETKYQNHGFPFQFNSPSDSLFTGIDWNEYNKDYEAFQKTNYFSDEFLARHRQIAMSIDSSVRQASAEWRNAKDGVPIWDVNADVWCNCQDHSDNYWERLVISDFKYNNETVSFNWIWGIEEGVDPPMKYKMRARKLNNTWKVSYMEGFDSYGTVADYNKQIKRMENLAE